MCETGFQRFVSYQSILYLAWHINDKIPSNITATKCFQQEYAFYISLGFAICCRAMIAQCLACTESQTVDDYCKTYPDTVGCPIKGSNNLCT